MTRFIQILIAVLVLAAIAAGVAYANRRDIGAHLIAEVATNSIFRDTIPTLPDGLHAGFCGTGSPFPSPTRSGPCTAIIAGRMLFVVDAGRGAADMLARMGMQPARLEAVLLTHFHSDHIDGLGQLAEHHWLAGSAKAPLAVIGNAGVERVVNGFNEAYAMNKDYRIIHEGPALAAAAGFGLQAKGFTVTTASESSVVVFDRDGLRITAFVVAHHTVEGAVGYRFDYKGRSIVVSGDTAPSSNLVKIASGADLLVHETMSPAVVRLLADTARSQGRSAPAALFGGVTDFHTTPAQAAAQAEQAGVRILALTHFIPPVPMNPLLEDLFLDDARSKFRGPLLLAEDGDLVSLPASSTAWSETNLLD
jgi:ribonuclease Z